MLLMRERRGRWRYAVAVVCLACLLASPAVAADDGAAAQSSTRQTAPRTPRVSKAGRAASPELVPGRYIVTIAPGHSSGDVARALGRKVRVRRRYQTALTGFSADMDAATAARLAADPRVLSVEQDRVMTTSVTQSAPPWGLDRIDQARRPMDSTYNHDSAGRGVRVYVIDSGVMASHREFGGRVLRGFTAFARGTSADCEGHGTHVAGTVAGSTYGVAKRAAIVPVRVMNCQGSGSASSIIAGLDYVARHHVRGTPAVANMSLGGPAFAPVDRAINRIIDDGVTVVVAAGNEGANACRTSPARVTRAITVAATNPRDYSPYWSNYGPCVDVFAPGTGVRSAAIWSRTASRTLAGTSMAAPHVAGVAARYLSKQPGATPGAVARYITTLATPAIVDNAGYNTVRRLLHIPGRVPTSLSLDASATMVTRGAPVILGATLRNASSGTPLPNRLLAVYRRPAGQTGWTFLTTRSTNSVGRAAVTVEVAAGTEYQLRHAATSTTQAVASRIATVAVDPRAGTTATLTPLGATALQYGDSIALSGTLRDDSGTPLAVHTVELQTRVAYTSTWTLAQVATSDADGVVAFNHSPDHNGEYRLRHAGTATTLASVSPVVPVKVAYRITSQASATTLGSDEPLWISGRIQPVSSAGTALVGYRDEYGTWDPWYDEISYDANGNFSFVDYPYWSGTHTYQIIMPADDRNARGVGPAHTVTVWCTEYEC